MSNQEDKIKLVLDEDQFPNLLKRYSLEKIKEIAVDMALKQYSERPVTAVMMHSCLANLESDLAGM
jgi:hypothetical protein